MIRSLTEQTRTAIGLAIWRLKCFYETFVQGQKEPCKPDRFLGIERCHVENMPELLATNFSPAFSVNDVAGVFPVDILWDNGD